MKGTKVIEKEKRKARKRAKTAQGTMEEGALDRIMCSIYVQLKPIAEEVREMTVDDLAIATGEPEGSIWVGLKFMYRLNMILRKKERKDKERGQKPYYYSVNPLYPRERLEEYVGYHKYQASVACAKRLQGVV